MEEDTGENVQYTSADVTAGTTACEAFRLYCAKKAQISDLEYECRLLVDKYHAEMRRADIPGWLREGMLDDLFAANVDRREAARELFVRHCFSDGFRERHEVRFVRMQYEGYDHVAACVVLGVDGYHYYVTVPLPQNIKRPSDKEHLMGMVMFRVHRLHESHDGDFCKELECVQPFTYYWRECFRAMEAYVERDQAGGGVTTTTTTTTIAEERSKET